ncbi:MAG: hypothetical protein GX423_11905 [Nitrospiraceae bacterium]|jgi:hypothetical protein|nr:hypothetical protein [Nitrospiraceae bacterium]
MNQTEQSTDTPPQTTAADHVAQKREKERLLVQLVGGLRVPTWFERSCKVADRKLFINRFVYTVKREDLGPDGEAKLLGVCEQLNMPEAQKASLRELFPRLAYILFGYEEGETSSVYKIYGEMLVDKKTIPFRRDPFIGAFGYKWDAFDPAAKHLVSEYTCHPGLSVDRLCERIAAIYDPKGVPFDISRSIIQCAAAKINAQDLLYLEVSDNNTRRNSFDLNLYDAGYQLRDFYALIFRLLRHYAIPPEVCEALHTQAGAVKFGHIAGGTDRNGKDFFSIYCGHSLVNQGGESTGRA